MRVFYVAIIATAALFATALARPGSMKKRHARKARSIFGNVHQQQQSNPDLDAIPTDWKYNQLDQGSVVPQYPDYQQFSNSDWNKLTGQVPQENNEAVGQFGSNSQITEKENLEDLVDFVDAIRSLKDDEDKEKIDIEKFVNAVGQLDSNSQMTQNENSTLMNELINSIRHSSRDEEKTKIDIARLENAVQRLEEDDNAAKHSNDARIPPVQQTHLPDLSQQQVDQSFGTPGFADQDINNDLNEGNTNGVEPPVHKKFFTPLDQHNNDHELNTNNIDQQFGGPGYPYDKQDQDQDQAQDQDPNVDYEDDYGLDSDWDDSDSDAEDSDYSDSFDFEDEDEESNEKQDNSLDQSVERKLDNLLEKYISAKSVRHIRSATLYDKH